MRRGALIIIGIVFAAIAVGCGGGDGGSSSGTGGGDAGAATGSRDAAVHVRAPSPRAIAACFRREGVTAVYRKQEEGVPFVNGLIRGANAVSAELTGSKARTKKLLERYEAEEPSSLEAFEVLEGTAVGVINEREPASKRIVLDCLE
ncbi:MAG: hypothetical protein ACOYD4_08960 [Solirubrobacterales bacterium]